MTTIVSHLSATGDLSEGSVNTHASSQKIFGNSLGVGLQVIIGGGVGVPTEKCMGPSQEQFKKKRREKRVRRQALVLLFKSEWRADVLGRGPC